MSACQLSLRRKICEFGSTRGGGNQNKTLSKRDLIFIFPASVLLPCCCCHTLSRSQGMMVREAVHQHFTCKHRLLSGNKLTADWRGDAQALIWDTNNPTGNSQPVGTKKARKQNNTKKEKRSKKRFLSGTPLFLVSPSQWEGEKNANLQPASLWSIKGYLRWIIYGRTGASS